MTTTSIRNYRGKLPAGTWQCEDCDFESRNLEIAAGHAESNDHWVWLFADGVSAASFEMHASDMGGVYLNDCAAQRMPARTLKAIRWRKQHPNFKSADSVF